MYSCLLKLRLQKDIENVDFHEEGCICMIFKEMWLYCTIYGLSQEIVPVNAKYFSSFFVPKIICASNSKSCIVLIFIVASLRLTELSECFQPGNFC